MCFQNVSVYPAATGVEEIYTEEHLALLGDYQEAWYVLQQI